MPKTRPPYDDDFDLLELFEVIWDGKRKIVASIFVSVLFGIALYSILPKSYYAITTITSAKPNVFLPYTFLNELLKRNGFPLSIDSENIFSTFVIEFNDYEEIYDVLIKNEYVKQSIEGLDEAEKRRELMKFKELFKLNPPSKKNIDWSLSIQWHDEEEGVRLLSAALEQILINIKKNIEIALTIYVSVIENRNSIESKNLRNALVFFKQNAKQRIQKRIQYLKEQSAIATELGIETYKFDSIPNSVTYKFDENLLPQSDQDEFSLFKSDQDGFSLDVESDNVPFYLLGYKAINNEIALIENRSPEELFIMSDGFLELKEKILSVESDLSSSQLKEASQMILGDKTNDWVDFNLRLIEGEEKLKLRLYIILSIGLGGIIGVINVFMSYFARKRKEKEKT